MNFLSIKLEEWWEDYAYLRPRYPLAPTINMSGLCVFFEDHFWPPEDGTQITSLLYFEAMEITVQVWNL